MHDERNPGQIQDGRLVGGVGLGIGDRSGIDRGVYIVLGPPAFGHTATTTGGGATVVKSIYKNRRTRSLRRTRGRYSVRGWVPADPDPGKDVFIAAV